LTRPGRAAAARATGPSWTPSACLPRPSRARTRRTPSQPAARAPSPTLTPGVTLTLTLARQRRPPGAPPRRAPWPAARPPWPTAARSARRAWRAARRAGGRRATQATAAATTAGAVSASAAARRALPAARRGAAHARAACRGPGVLLRCLHAHRRCPAMGGHSGAHAAASSSLHCQRPYASASRAARPQVTQLPRHLADRAPALALPASHARAKALAPCPRSWTVPCMNAPAWAAVVAHAKVPRARR